MRLLVAALLCLPMPALAFCGFFVSGADAKLSNNASQVALMRHGQTTVLSMSNTYKGPPQDFAMVVPVPVVLQKDQVKTLKPTVFDKIDKLSAPRLVEYWEKDPCAPVEYALSMRMSGSGKGGGGAGFGQIGGRGFGVKVEAKFSAGEYEVVILSAKEANGLEGWLKHNNYNIPAGASEALAPYIKGGMKFFVAKVNIKKVKRNRHGQVVLSPLRFHFEDKTLRLPVRLGLLNADGKQDLIVYILHQDSRFEVANYKNVFIPSNLEVLNAVRRRFGSFYAELFDRTLAEAGGRAVVTEYAWQTGSCDPCPVPPLKKSDMFDLGGEVIGLGKGEADDAPTGSGPVFTSNFSRWVLTRLHTRYDKKTLDEDLIFVPAKPVVGGRGNAGISREKPGAVNPAASNNFQGRYIIRHYWAGEVACQDPRWGRWGGPPSGGKKKARAAQGLANAKRGGIDLTRVVKSALPRLQIPGQPEPKRK